LVEKVEMCKWYESVDRKPACLCAFPHKASVKCHSKRLDCHNYEPSESKFEESLEWLKQEGFV